MNLKKIFLAVLKKDNTKGLMTIELSIVFPVIMFIVLAFIYCALYIYQIAHLQNIANRTAQHGSATWNVATRDVYMGRTEAADFNENDPYWRLYDTKREDKRKKVESYGTNMVKNYNAMPTNGKSTSSSMKGVDVDVQVYDNIISKKLKVTISQSYFAPIGKVLNVFGVKDAFTAKAYAESSINEPSEFIRNTDFVIDVAKEVDDKVTGGKADDKIYAFKTTLSDFFKKMGTTLSSNGDKAESDPSSPDTGSGKAIIMAGNDRDLKDAARKIKPIPGYTDIVVHASGDKFKILENGTWKELGHEQMAEYIKGKVGDKTGPIRLVSCGTGSAESELAKDLSNKLNVEVKAPSDTVWIHGDGSLTIGATEDANTGEWKTFKPANKP